MKIFVAWSVDQLEGLTASALMADNVGELRSISQGIRRAADDVKSWAMAVGGSPILDLSTVGAVEVPADRMTELPGVAQKFELSCEGTLSIGVGMSLSEAYSAMRYSSLKGGNQISLYHAEMEQEIAGEGAGSGPDELMSLGKSSKTGQEEPTGFADGPEDAKPVGTTTGQAAQHGQKFPAEGHASIQPQSAIDPGSPAAPDMQADSSQDPNGGQPAEEGGGDQDPRAAVVQALQQIKSQAAVLEQMKQSNPQAYEAVKAVVAAMIMMAQGMAVSDGGEEGGGESSGGGSSDADTSKSEALDKGWGEDHAAPVHSTDLHTYHVMPMRDEERHTVIAKPKNPKKKLIHLGFSDTHAQGVEMAHKHAEKVGFKKEEMSPGERGEHSENSLEGVSGEESSVVEDLVADGKVKIDGIHKDEMHAGPTALHSTVEGFMHGTPGAPGLKHFPKGSPARGKFITQHMNHAPFVSALQTHPAGKQISSTLNAHLNSTANAGFRPGATVATAKAEMGGEAKNFAVGTEKDGKIKVQHEDVDTGAPGKTAWRSVRAGQVMSDDGHAVSSRNPKST